MNFCHPSTWESETKKLRIHEHPSKTISQKRKERRKERQGKVTGNIRNESMSEAVTYNCARMPRVTLTGHQEWGTRGELELAWSKLCSRQEFLPSAFRIKRDLISADRETVDTFLH